MAIENLRFEEPAPSFLTKSLKKHATRRSSADQISPIGTTPDWESFNYSGRMGQICERVTTAILTNRVTIPNEVPTELNEEATVVSSFINSQLELIPKNRNTFPNSTLWPIYKEVLNEEKTTNAVMMMAVGIDATFKTDLFGEYAKAMKNTDDETGEKEIPKTARYLIDALLTITRLMNDEETLKKLRSYGNLLPNLHAGVAQIDGLILDHGVKIPPLKDWREKEEFLINNSRRPRLKRFKQTVDHIVDNCVYLEIKTEQKAKYVSQRPLSHTPRKQHVMKAFETLRTICCQTDVSLAPKSIVVLYLGSLQPNRVHEIPCDYEFWKNQATLTEEIMLKGYGNYADYERGEFAPYLDFATNMAEEMKNKLPKFRRTRITKQMVAENSNAVERKLRGSRYLGAGKIIHDSPKSPDLTGEKKPKKEKCNHTGVVYDFYETLENKGYADRVFNDIDMNMEAGFENEDN